MISLALFLSFLILAAITALCLLCEPSRLGSYLLILFLGAVASLDLVCFVISVLGSFTL
jgi:hypothetical protein